MRNPFIKFIDQFYEDLHANPDTTEADFNAKALLNAFLEKHPLDENELHMLAWYAGDIICNRNQHG